MDKIKAAALSVGASTSLVDTHKAAHSQIPTKEVDGCCVAQVAQNNVSINYKAVEAKARADL